MVERVRGGATNLRVGVQSTLRGSEQIFVCLYPPPTCDILGATTESKVSLHLVKKVPITLNESIWAYDYCRQGIGL